MEELNWHYLAYGDLGCTVEEAKRRVGRAAFFAWCAYRQLDAEAQKKAAEEARHS